MLPWNVLYQGKCFSFERFAPIMGVDAFVPLKAVVFSFPLTHFKQDGKAEHSGALSDWRVQDS